MPRHDCYPLIAITNLDRQDVFSEYISEIFGGIVPSIKNSLAWQRELQAAQRHVLAAEGERALSCVFSHLNYAPQGCLSSKLEDIEQRYEPARV